MQNDDFNQDGPDLPRIGDRGPQTRRQLVEGHPGDRPCRHCGQPVQGRRRNGYCSDACRLRDRRDQERRRRLELLDTISAAVEELRSELGGSERASVGD